MEAAKGQIRQIISQNNKSLSIVLSSYSAKSFSLKCTGSFEPGVALPYRPLVLAVGAPKLSFIYWSDFPSS